MNSKTSRTSRTSRIEELSKQCWSHYIDGTLIDGHLHFDYQKFAELIITEAAKVARDYTLRKSGVSEDFDGTVFVQEAIKQHFGVQE